MGAIVLAIIWGGFLMLIQSNLKEVLYAMNSISSPDTLLGSIIHFLW